MKNILIALTFLLFNSCKKNENIINGNFTATFDGTNHKKFSSPDFLLTTENFGGITQFTLVMEAFELTNFDYFMQATIISYSPITSKTYTSNSISESLTMDYINNATNDSYGAADTTVTDPMTLTITSISSESIQGYFSGTLYKDNDYRQNKIIVTNGKFNIPYKGTTPIPLPINIETRNTLNILQTTAVADCNIISDGGSPITQRGVCWNINHNPTIQNSKSFSGTGVGAYTSPISGLKYGTTYYVRAFAKNGIYTAYGNEISFTTKPLTYPGGGVTDVDGNTYTSVVLNNKEWMVQNLRTAHYRNGDIIPNATTNTAWQNAVTNSTGAWCYYNNNATLNNTYGKLYNEITLSDTREIAPSGWHVPTSIEWNELFTYLGGPAIAGGLMKESGTGNWASPNTGATNSSGFTALPGGIRSANGSFTYFAQYAIWPAWDLGGFYKYFLYYGSAGRNYYTYTPGDGFSIRCVKD